MAKPFRISLDLTTIGEMAKSGHSSIKRSEKNGKVYLALNVWVNDQRDQYGKDISVTVDSTKAGKAAGEGKVYVGSGKTGNDEGQGYNQSQAHSQNVEQEQRGYPGGAPRAGEAGTAEDLPF